MDRVTEALLEGLKKALTSAEEQRLHRSGKLEGLFPARTGAGTEAAQQALQQNLLEVIRTESRGKSSVDWVKITPAGVDYIHEHESPIRVLRELREILQTNQLAIPVWLQSVQEKLQQLDRELLEEARRWHTHLGALERRVESALERLEAATPLLSADVVESYPWGIDALNYLDRRQSAGSDETPSCPLPELFEALRRQHPDLSLNTFHEGLRCMQARRALSLEPTLDPASLPEPEYALLDGTQVLYYAVR